jgi:mannan endo-1,4-beta-mannosidase
MVALTENGAIPNPDNCFTDGASWLWFCTWNDSRTNQQMITDGTQNNEGNFLAGEYHNTDAHKQHVYTHPKVVTLDKLPDLTTYRLE